MGLTDTIDKINYLVNNFPEVVKGFFGRILNFLGKTPEWIIITIQIIGTILIILLIIYILKFLYKRRNAWIYKC